MDLQRLTTFLTVADTLNFTRSAEALDYAQSSVTAQIRDLEHELGVPLFERLGKRVVLSTAGRRFIPYAERLLQLVEEAKLAIPDYQEPGGTLTVGAAESMCTYRLPPVLSRFHEQFPKVQLTFRPDDDADLPRMLVEGKLDICILLAKPVHPGNLVVETLAPEPLAVVTYPSHPLAQLSSVHPSHLHGETLLLTESGCVYRELFQATLAQDSVSGHVLEFGSIEAIKQCVMACMGISFLPVVAVEAELAQGRLVRLPWSAGDYCLTTQLAWHRDKWLSPALRAFIDLTRSVMAAHTGDVATLPRIAGSMSTHAVSQA